MRQNTIVGPSAWITSAAREPVARVHRLEPVLGVQRVGLLARHLVADRVALVAAGDDADVAVERGREEDGLTLLGGGVEDAAHRGEEAHVGHPVGFVDHDDLDHAEVDDPLRDQVFEPAGAGDEDVDAPAHRPALRLVADTAVDGEDGPVPDVGERRQLTLDLRGELAGRREHEGAGLLGLRAPDPVDERDAEGDGLAGAGGGAPADVATREQVGDREGLDREGRGDAAVGEHGDEVGGNAEIGEAGHVELPTPRGGTWPPKGARYGPAHLLEQRGTQATRIETDLNPREERRG